MKVLVIDDSPIALQVVEAVLTSRGHEVVKRASPFGTTAEIIREKPDFVVIDVNMPALSGTNLVKLIREAGCAVRIILFSDTGDLAALASDCGADGYVEKDPEKLAEYLESGFWG